LLSGEPDVAVPDEERLTGCVHITGEWRGAVLVEASDELSREAASAMFATPVADLSADEIADSLGELANMIGGNVKSLLPGPSTLSTPTVAQGPAYMLRMPGAVCINLVRLAWHGQPFTVTLWQS
jgi:chemotaxis protein CheX